MNDLNWKVYFSNLVSKRELEIAANSIESLSQRKILINPIEGYEFALYTEIESKYFKDHKYYNQISYEFEPDSKVISIEFFCRNISKSNIFRLVGRNIFNIENYPQYSLKFSFTKGDDSGLVVYFDYSRLVEKIELNDSFIPKFNFRTKKNILIISNALGYWGTSMLFDSNGNLIVNEISNLILRKAAEIESSEIYLVGGSQGGTAAIVYGAFFSRKVNIYAACPVIISDKSMLKHLAHHLSKSDLDYTLSLFDNSLKQNNTNIYTSVGDSLYAWHSNLGITYKDNVHVTQCGDSKIKHGDVLKYFIKEIYSAIN